MLHAYTFIMPSEILKHLLNCKLSAHVFKDQSYLLVYASKVSQHVRTYCHSKGCRYVGHWGDLSSLILDDNHCSSQIALEKLMVSYSQMHCASQMNSQPCNDPVEELILTAMPVTSSVAFLQHLWQQCPHPPNT